MVFTASKLIAPGARPIGIGETSRCIISKAILVGCSGLFPVKGQRSCFEASVSMVKLPYKSSMSNYCQGSPTAWTLIYIYIKGEHINSYIGKAQCKGTLYSNVHVTVPLIKQLAEEARQIWFAPILLLWATSINNIENAS